MSGDDSDSSARPAKKLKPGPVVARETTGTIIFTVPDATALDATEVTSAQKPIGELLWRLAASNAPAPDDPAKSALLVRVLASHPSGRASNWAAFYKATVTLQAPPGTERQPSRSEFTVYGGDWKNDESDKEKFLAEWAVVESDDVDAENDSLSLGCEIAINKMCPETEARDDRTLHHEAPAHLRPVQSAGILRDSRDLVALVQSEDGSKLSDRANSAILRKIVGFPLLSGRPRVEEVPYGTGTQVVCNKCTRRFSYTVVCSRCP